MDTKMLGWIQIVGGALALLYPGGGLGFGGMMGYGGVTMRGGFAVTIVALLFVITGIYQVSYEK